MNAISGFHVRAVLFAHHMPAKRIDALRRRWRRLTAALLDPYRPELHYMRGPGPKWHAKHGASEPGEARDFAESAAIAA